LSDFYSAVAGRITAQGGRIQLRAGVDSIVQTPDGRWLLHTADNAHVADDIILALPFEQTQRLLSTLALSDPALQPARAELLEKISHFSHSPYISVLLWFDRQITDIDHAWLLDSPIHWFFHKSRIRGTDVGKEKSGAPQAAADPQPSGAPHLEEMWENSTEQAGASPPPHSDDWESYIELVISGSRADLPKSREQLLATALAELARFFPDATRARLVKSGVLKEARATFTLPPGQDSARPPQATTIPGLYLAGDWTATTWPSTMEGACRSGRLAAGALTGSPTRFLTPDDPPSGLSRLLATS
jgi:zeta-carotene desaturase